MNRNASVIAFFVFMPAVANIARVIIANPDLVERFKHDAELNAQDNATFYAPGAKGYTDYPTLNKAA